MRRRRWDRGARGGRDGMPMAGWMGAALFMMHSSFPTAASSWMTTPPPRDGQGAETPGQFAVLPPTGFAMYAPDVRGRGREARLRIVD